MNKEKSCGIIIFTLNQQKLQFLLIQSKRDNFWGFPKGHQEENETDLETALRETKEETSLAPAILKEFKASISYTVKNSTPKEAVYFLGEVSKNARVVIQESEVSGYCWLSFAEALKLLIFENQQKLFTKAHDFLLKMI